MSKQMVFFCFDFGCSLAASTDLAFPGCERTSETLPLTAYADCSVELDLQGQVGECHGDVQLRPPVTEAAIPALC